jgi:hypothetical protein
MLSCSHKYFPGSEKAPAAGPVALPPQAGFPFPDLVPAIGIYLLEEKPAYPTEMGIRPFSGLIGGSAPVVKAGSWGNAEALL